ncbi:Cysteine dioxygenase type I (plasmid) [Cupriavidus taiwanensis]|uniref:Cysteine dioxygenase type I n=1 Tax=Cupriavidus taiwanensis TaxID=164546 RepID=A0A375HFQ0_9BURK|nr:cysteine dioxygenase family protein [Cupriavidus taiwanensis]SOY70329.1 Cysteine dioxygenase type I [Cupriavidus taiwanensis]SOY70726.1 Cysteine dioxygenase type I [Cupriavidus taiwanensis]SOY95570.1 Cysteine dioxygenase type I [Cupriavidus taiwanensis]SOZ74491.1 Cysteine dioxygenase type I [Cupriavidus taiwanensis]SOZ88313.1 Cysteine dioxygenase type I [Cupriavidus taiwanensis]
MCKETQSPSAALAALTSAIAQILDSSRLPDVGAIRSAILHAFRSGVWIPHEQREPGDESYVRHVLHSDPARRYTVLALVWKGGQASPIHAHHTWCAYSVVSGELFEERFSYDAAGHGAVATHGASRRPGDGGCGPAGLNQIHRLRNSRDETAISVHAYGVPATELSQGVNNVLPLLEPASL